MAAATPTFPSASAPSTSASPQCSFTAQRSGPFVLCRTPLFPLHRRARGPHPLYPARQAVGDAEVDFSVAWPEYSPPHFTVASTAEKSPDAVSAAAVSDWASRPPSSYPFVLAPPPSSAPLNPFGRTGLADRGKLYFWGPNHAADCVLTRDREGGKEGERELLVIRRGDTGEWAVVGGMIDKGETPEQCIRREFGEEVLGVAEEGEGSGADEGQRAVLDALFAPANMRVVYRGYVDDGRNTDHSWIETCAFALDLPASISREEAERRFVGGSDAVAVRWVECREGVEEFDRLYASHKPMVQLALQQRHSRV